MTANELLPSYNLAVTIMDFLQAHPESEWACRIFYGSGLFRELVQAGDNVQQGIINAAALEEMLVTWSGRLLRLAAPTGNWN